MRTYANAMFRAAVVSADDPEAPRSLAAFRLETVPGANIKAQPDGGSTPGDRILSPQELAGYVRHLKAMKSSTPRDLLLLSLYLGGQRLVQVGAASLDSVVTVTGSQPVVKILDAKGRRTRARVHLVPVVGYAADLIGERGGLFGLADKILDDGTIKDGPLTWRAQDASGLALKISRELIAEGVSTQTFSAHDLRRTIETVLRGPGRYSKDIVGQLLSHETGGVQQRHYDMNLYLDEKRSMLEWLNNHIDSIDSYSGRAVIPFPAKTTKNQV